MKDEGGTHFEEDDGLAENHEAESMERLQREQGLTRGRGLQAEKASETAVRRMEKINQEAVKKEMMKKSQSASFGRTGSSGNKKSSGYDDPDLISRQACSSAGMRRTLSAQN
eukprot:1253821-Rhodomonas_salina.2